MKNVNHNIANTSKLEVTQIRSPIGRPSDQEKTLIGLGLNKLHRSRIHDNTSSIRGMLRKVKHLIRIEPIN